MWSRIFLFHGADRFGETKNIEWSSAVGVWSDDAIIVYDVYFGMSQTVQDQRSNL